ncbi:butyrate kinase [Hominifimenecus sp. rT4P-3]|uniref:butyrate kinase n=1 Tax=Hominifimenecus sp. rT4P-3 TaxID=3242979 RepID=UPI003DA3F90C
MEEKYRLLVINTGSTSTKLALYENETLLAGDTVVYSPEELSKYPLVTDQHEMRKQSALQFLKDNQTELSSLNIVVSRGGSTKPVESGAYEVGDSMVDRLKNKPFVQHAGILGPVIAREIADMAGVKAYVYDSAATDELSEVARISGMKEIERVSLVHVLNTRYSSRLVCERIGMSYEDANIIAVHMGGGITLSLHEKGRVTDVVGDEEGTFSPERAGGVPTRQLVDFCFSGQFQSAREVHSRMRGKGGLISYLGTGDVREVERRIEEGDDYARLILDAMILQISKNIASLAPVVNGKVDFILLTGAIAKSNRIVEGIQKRVGFLAKIFVEPGEHEMEGLCFGGLEILRGNIPVKQYQEKEGS